LQANSIFNIVRAAASGVFAPLGHMTLGSVTAADSANGVAEAVDYPFRAWIISQLKWK